MREPRAIDVQRHGPCTLRSVNVGRRGLQAVDLSHALYAGEIIAIDARVGPAAARAAIAERMVRIVADNCNGGGRTLRHIGDVEDPIICTSVGVERENDILQGISA